MKKLLLLSLIVAFATSLKAQETGHYVNGVEGIKTGSVPGPGFYYKMYNAYYSTDALMDGKGNELNIDFDLTVLANTHRFIWISKKELLGGNFGMNVIVPLVNTDISIGAFGLADKKFGLSDITVEPFLLAWHKPKYDLAVGLAAVIPVGDYDKTKIASPGKGMWTGMLTAGATYYFDKHKSWSAGILARYEIHSEKKDYDVTPGNDFHFEWGITKTIPMNVIWELGITGYCGWQITDDKGSDVVYDADIHDRQFAIGPEVCLFVPKAKMSFSLRAQKEFGVIDRSEGFINCLSIVKVF